MGFPERWLPKISRDKTMFLPRQFCTKIRMRCFALSGEFTQYPFFVRFRPFFYVFAFS